TFRAQAEIRLAMQSGTLIHVTQFREQTEQSSGREQAALELLNRSAACSGSDEGFHQTARLLIDWLELDMLMLLEVSDEPDDEAHLLVQYQRHSLSNDAPDPLRQPTLQQVLHGDTLIFTDQAFERLEGDRFLAFQRLHMFAGVPLHDDRRNVFGA